MSSKQLRADLLSALQTLVKGDLRIGATALLATLGYASHKTLDLPADPQTFAREIEKLLGSTSQLNTAHANPADWNSAAFLFQLTNDELPALAAGQLSLLQDAGGVQAHQIESFVFLALDLKAGNWSNRIPVLDVMQQHFGEWQIVLLTHDRAFYEIGKQRLDSGKWVRQEIYAGRVGNFEKPLLVDDELDLYRALAFLDKGEIKAAAVHVRSAFERVLKDACCDLHVPVKYHHDPRKVPASELWAALSSKKYKTPAKMCAGLKQGKPIRWITKEVEVSVVPQQLANRINHSVSWVLNPLSHSQTVDRYRREIEDAIYAVDDLAAGVHRALQVQKTRPIELLQYLATALNARAVQLAAST